MAATAGCNTRPYHRQLPGGPTIVVRNGFLDSSVKEAPLPRTASAPAGLLREALGGSPTSLDSTPNRRGSAGSSPLAGPAPAAAAPKAAPLVTAADTDIDSDSTASFGESLRSSPYLAAAAASPILQAVAKQVARQAEGAKTSGSGSCGSSGAADWAQGAAPPAAGEASASQAPWDGDWMLPDTAWSGDQAFCGGSVEIEMHIEDSDPSLHTVGVPQAFNAAQMPAAPVGMWVPGSPQLSCPNSPAWSFTASPLLLAQVSPIGSPALMPQVAYAVPPAAWAPAAAWQGQVQVSPRPSPQQSQLSSPQISPKASPLLSPQLSPFPSPSLGPLKSPPLRGMSPPVPELFEAALQDDHTWRKCVNSDKFEDHPSGWPADVNIHELETFVSQRTGVHRVIWTVDASKLESMERQVVSKQFLVRGHKMRLCLFPRDASKTPGKENQKTKGSSNFKAANGVGYVHLKSESTSGTVSFVMSVTDGTSSFPRRPRGPVTHDFGTNTIVGLPSASASGEDNQWDFKQALRRAPGGTTFSVCLEILPQPSST